MTAIQWSNCTESDPPGLQCGTLQVPLDYGHQYGQTIKLGLARLRTNSSMRLGNLHINPGGPGGSGSELIIAQALGADRVFSDDLLAHYDVIGIDPRGIGLSDNVKCDPDIFNQRVSTAATDTDSFNKLVAHNKALGESCARLTGPLINFLDTASVARDFDSVRKALGDKKLNYLGLSYGTQIGAQYAELFPDRVGRFVLDGILDHSSDLVHMLYPETTTYETTLNQFFDWCKTADDCAIRAKGDPAEFFDALVRSADRKPLPAPSCNATGDGACRSDVTSEELLYNVQGGLLSQNDSFVPGWATLARNLVRASDGDAANLSAPLATSQRYAGFSANAIAAQDWERVASAADVAQLLRMARAFAPHTRGFCQSLSIQTTVGWPAPVSNPPHVLGRGIKKAPRILMVNALHDPSTSLVWAENVRTQIPSAHLILRDGAGHTSYLLFGETSKAIDAMLVEGKFPADGTIFES